MKLLSLFQSKKKRSRIFGPIKYDHCRKYQTNDVEKQWKESDRNYSCRNNWEKKYTRRVDNQRWKL